MTISTIFSIIFISLVLLLFYSIVDEVCIKIKTWRHYSWLRDKKKLERKKKFQRDNKYRKKMKLFAELNKLDEE